MEDPQVPARAEDEKSEENRPTRRLSDVEAVASARRDMFGDGSLLDVLAGAQPHAEPLPAPAAAPEAADLPSSEAAAHAAVEAPSGPEHGNAEHDPGVASPAIPARLADVPQSLDAIIDSFPAEPDLTDAEQPPLDQTVSDADPQSVPPPAGVPAYMPVSAIFAALDGADKRTADVPNEAEAPAPAAFAPDVLSPPHSLLQGDQAGPAMPHPHLQDDDQRPNDGGVDTPIDDTANGAVLPARFSPSLPDLGMPPMPEGDHVSSSTSPPFPHLHPAEPDAAEPLFPAAPAPAVVPPYFELPADPAPAVAPPYFELPADPAPAVAPPYFELPADPAPAVAPPYIELPAEPQFPDPAARPYPEPAPMPAFPESFHTAALSHIAPYPGAREMPGFSAHTEAAPPGAPPPSTFDAAAKIAAEANATAEALENLQRLLASGIPGTDDAQAAGPAPRGTTPANMRGDPSPFAPLAPMPLLLPPDHDARVKGVYALGFVTGLALSIMAGAALYFLINLG